MARLTVEDCVLKVPNRFDLVLVAGQRAREIAAGAPLTVDRDNDKNPVIALREIADASVDLDNLRQGLVQGLQKQVETEEPEEDTMELLAADRDVAGVPIEMPSGDEAMDEGGEIEADVELPAGDET